METARTYSFHCKLLDRPTSTPRGCKSPARRHSYASTATIRLIHGIHLLESDSPDLADNLAAKSRHSPGTRAKAHHEPDAGHQTAVEKLEAHMGAASSVAWTRLHRQSAAVPMNPHGTAEDPSCARVAPLSSENGCQRVASCGRRIAFSCHEDDESMRRLMYVLACRRQTRTVL